MDDASEGLRHSDDARAGFVVADGYQIIGRNNNLAPKDFLVKEDQVLLPFVESIERAEKALDEVIDVAGRAMIEVVLQSVEPPTVEPPIDEVDAPLHNLRAGRAWVHRMPRQLISRAELTRILTERMQHLPKGKACSLGGVLRLVRPDEDGCNWKPGTIGDSCRAALDEVVAKARFEFNLEEER